MFNLTPPNTPTVIKNVGDYGLDYMVNFSLGWKFSAPPTGLKYCCDYMLNFSPGAKRQFPWESLLRCENNRYACSRSFFSPGWKNNSDYMDFSARLAGLKILARFENTGLGFSAQDELHPGLNPSPCNRQLGFQRICFRSRSEISAWDETHHVIGPYMEYWHEVYTLFCLNHVNWVLVTTKIAQVKAQFKNLLES